MKVKEGVGWGGGGEGVRQDRVVKWIHIKRALWDEK